MGKQKKWHILFCDEIEQACPVTEFINDCRPEHQVGSKDTFPAGGTGAHTAEALCRYLELDFMELSRNCPKFNLIDS